MHSTSIAFHAGWRHGSLASLDIFGSAVDLLSSSFQLLPLMEAEVSSRIDWGKYVPWTMESGSSRSMAAEQLTAKEGQV